MSESLLRRIEEFRKKRDLPILTLCKMMDVHNVTYHRWKNAGKITGAYNKIIEDFLARNDDTASTSASDIAVIGMSCYYPGASNVSELWENILARRVQFRRMLDQRLPLSEYYNEDPKFPDKTYLTKAAFLENFNFDWGKLRIPKKTVESTDIAHWIALDIALKTFEDAGYKLSDIPLQNTGVIVGNTLTGEQTRSQTLRLRWPYVQKALNATLGHLGKSLEERSHIASEMEKIFKSAFYPLTEDSLAGGLANTIAGRICNYLNLKGGGYIVDGACSSSLLAVATAADALKMGNMDLALAGGVDISLDPFELVGFAKAGALAKDQMRVYDQKAAGFLPGEGCGFVLLKRLKDAIRDKNYVYAVIKGWGISSDGKGGIMEPSSSGQSFAIGRAYKDLEYKISDVDFVEGHGTGTTKGDRVELEGIAAAIDKTIKPKDKNKRGCGVTSFKSIVGHTKAAAGVGGLIKAVMAVNQHILPPTANCTHPNDVFKDKAKNLFPIILGGRLPLDQKVRAGVSSAGFGGINCHVTLESRDKPQEKLRSKLDERALFVSHQQTEIFAFTSRSVTHLEKIIHKFKIDLRNISIAEMADLAALLNNKVKNRLPIKVAIVTDSPEHLYDALVLIEKELEQVAIEEGKVHRIKAKDPNTQIILSKSLKKNRIGFLYPGQGSQRLNMTRTVVHRYQWARDHFKLSSLPLFEKVYLATDKFFTKDDQQEFEKELSDTRITQPAIVISSLIWTDFFSSLGIEPQACVGHSLGELTAFYKAGAFNKETLVKFAQLRGELMASDGRSSGRMVSLFCPKGKAEALIEKAARGLVIANINHPNQIVVSGAKNDIEKLIELAKKEGVSASPLNVSNAFHSSFMKDASEQIKKTRILPGAFKSRGIKVYSCMSGKVVNGKVDLKEYFSKQVISPVDFVNVIEAASQECDLMIELGPGRVLTDLVKAINKDVLCLPVESSSGNDRDLNMVLAELFVRNVPVNWGEFYKKRLIRTFVPASRKKFIENQCEHPLKIDKQVIENRLLPVLLQANIEADQKEEIIPGGLPELAGKDKVSDLLITLTHEITGFDRESISLNLRLLDDLNLDSIKAAELIGKAARSLGIPGQIDPSQLSNNTLGQISEKLTKLLAAAKTGHAGESLSDILKHYQGKQWVRDFVLDLKAEEIKTRNVNQLKGLKNIVYLSGKDEEGLVKRIEKELNAAKSRARHPLKDKHIDCLVAVLPKNIPLMELNKVSLRSMIERLHQVTGLASSSQLGKDSLVVFVQFGGGGTSIASTLFLERPELKVRVIDFDAGTDEGKISQKVIDELQTYDQFSSVRYDAKLTRRVVYYGNARPENYKDRGISWSDKDVVLVTGGAKGITAQCALEFARSTRAQMVLVGRSPVPEGMKDGVNEIVQTLKQFKDEGLVCSYYQCDVANEKDVINTIAQIEKKAGLITGFIHGAGLNSLKRLKQASVQEAFHESLPKVIGAVNICRALKDHPPKLIAGITSIIGLTGMEGSGWYGFSNELLDLYLGGIASAAKRPFKTEVVTIAYSVWEEVGMGAKLGSVNRLAEKGIGAIPVKEGIKHFRQLIQGDPGTRQVIVAARVAGIGTWKSQMPKANHFRFLEKIEYLLPGVEIIARANLNVEDDPYLLDHNWKGSLLFPFVFGFEAMAQAVAYVSGVDKFDNIKARDINLQRPIPVPQESEATIEIHALIEGNEVRVEVYSQETGYREPHFSAVFERGGGIVAGKTSRSLLKRAGNLIDLDMKTDIYGPILFQGEMFQCIERVHELYYNEEIRKGECVFTSVYNKTAEEFLKKNKKFNKRFLIGDPFFIDSMLQSMQLIIPRDISLPRDIQEILLSKPSIKESKEFQLHSNIKRIDNDHYRGDAEVIKDGSLIKVINCRLKVLDTLLSNPSANDLADPAKRDQRSIENKLELLSKELGFIPPVVKCAYDQRLINASKESRHKIELPLIKDAVKELFRKEGKKIGDFDVKWLKSGKPVLEGKGLEDVGVSLSHDGAFLIVVAGHGEQGCDVESIQERTKNDWIEILGKEKYSILDKFKFHNEDLNVNGTLLWSIIETSRKMTSVNEVEVRCITNRKDVIISEIKNSNFDLDIISLNTNSNNKINSIFSFGIKVSRNANVNEAESAQEISIFKRMGYDESVFKTNFDFNGPQGQPVYMKRIPITFKNNQNASRTVYFSNYFDWMGLVREYSLLPISKNLREILETGLWGMATNFVKFKFFKQLVSDDVLEVRLWLNRVSGQKNAVFDLKYDWLRVLPNNMLEEIATSEQRISWIKITGHGEGYVESLPESIQKFMDLMKPKEKLEELGIASHQLDLGKEIIDCSKRRPLLSEQTFVTALEESNLVGNIYFSNYGKWLGKTRDLYFFEIMPQFYLGTQNIREFFCTNCDINYLNEAMPFDKIKVKMFLNKVFENSLELYFEFHKDNGDGSEKRLAFASHTVIWGFNSKGDFKAERLPQVIHNNLSLFVQSI